MLVARKRMLIGSAISAPAVVHSAAYANTLTRLFPELYAALAVVSRELVGFIPSVYRNTSVERAAIGQAVVYAKPTAQTTFTVTPAMTIPEPADKSLGNGALYITKAEGVEFGWTGEEQRAINSGIGQLTVQGLWFAEALRTLCNKIEADLAAVAAANASRWAGTAGTTPFATNLGDSAQVRKILDDNGAPASGRTLIIDTTAAAAMRTLGQLTKANEAGTTMTLRDGELLNLHGFSIKESAQVSYFTAGTASGATTNTTGYAKGSTSIGTAAAGTGVIKAGDVIQFAGDSNKYTVVTGKADVSSGTAAIVIADPGLRVAIPTAATNITVIASHAQNVAFAQTAIHLAARAPALPNEGDIAIDRTVITDPRSGLSFEVAIYPGYRKIRAEVTIAWGVGATQPEHIAGLLG